MSAGASWGAWLLIQIGFNGSYTREVTLSHINSHGHVMIFGWVILFMMGFAYQALPRMWRVGLYRPHLALRCFMLMFVGIVARMLGMGFDLGGFEMGLMLTGSGFEVVAIMLFIFQMYKTFDASDQWVTPYVGLIGMGFFWMLVQSVFGVWHFYRLHILTGDELLYAVATYQAPLRDMQIHGMAMCMIFGVGMRGFVGMFGFKALEMKAGWWVFGLINLSVLLEVVLFLVYRKTGNHFYAGLLMLPWLGLFGGSLIYVNGMGLFRGGEMSVGVAKYIRMAFVWLMVSLVMLLLLPVYQVVSEIKFSHAYYGAIRHAITVGFVTQLILGMSTKMVGVLNRIADGDGHWIKYSFWLVNIGCFLRVFLQISTDWHEGAYGLVGVSGMLEVTGIFVWAVMIFKWMRRGELSGV